MYSRRMLVCSLRTNFKLIEISQPLFRRPWANKGGEPVSRNDGVEFSRHFEVNYFRIFVFQAIYMVAEVVPQP